MGQFFAKYLFKGPKLLNPKSGGLSTAEAVEFEFQRSSTGPGYQAKALLG
jgi:hypothetical protein